MCRCDVELALSDSPLGWFLDVRRASLCRPSTLVRGALPFLGRFFCAVFLVIEAPVGKAVEIPIDWGTSVISVRGVSAPGSREGRVRNVWPNESCAQNGKWITSFTAIVAPHPCDLVRGALVLVTPARPACLLCLLLGLLTSPSVDASTPISCGLVFFYFGHLFFTPRF
jgi:hypothetical protein